MIQQQSLSILAQGYGFALIGIADWLSTRDDVPENIKRDFLSVLTAVPILVGGDLGEEAEGELKERANRVLVRLIGKSIY